MIRIGHGYDVHKLVEGRKLILGGVHIPYEKGLLGHSDADVLAHAIADALLGKRIACFDFRNKPKKHLSRFFAVVADYFHGGIAV